MASGLPSKSVLRILVYQVNGTCVEGASISRVVCGVDWGELTDVGRSSTLRLGQELRRLYVDKLKYIPSHISASQQQILQLESTAVPRAKESMRMVLEGFLPPQDRQFEPDVLVRSPKEECLYPNTACPLYRALHRKYIKGAAQKWDDKLLAPLDSKIAHLVGVPVRIQSHPTANGVSDTIRGCQAHMISVPPVFEEPEVIESMEKAIVQEWFSGYIDKQLSRLSMGRLLGNLQGHFQLGIASQPSPVKVGLYACHDTTLAGALKVLDCFDDRWPFFTAFLSFELLRKQQTSSPLTWILDKFSGSKPVEEHFVRVKYNTKDMHLPACAPVGKHLEGSDGSVCTLAAFKEAIKDVVMTTEEWQKECQLPMQTQV